MAAVEELEKDFSDALKKIDFAKYSPRSQEFLDALFIGLMRLVLCGTEKHSAGVERHDESDNCVSEKIAFAKNALRRFAESGDEAYKEMCLDELRHARTLLKKAYAKFPNAEEKTRLRGLEAEAEEISRQVEKA